MTEIVGENPEEDPERDNLARMLEQPVVSRKWVIPVLEKSETVKLVSFNIDKLTKLNVRDWKNRVQRFLDMQDLEDYKTHRGIEGNPGEDRNVA